MQQSFEVDNLTIVDTRKARVEKIIIKKIIKTIGFFYLNRIFLFILIYLI